MIRIAYVEKIESDRFFDRPDAFSYRPEKGWKWAQRLVLAFLRRIEAYAVGKESEVQYVTKEIEYDSFGHAVFDQMNKIKRQGGEPTHILLGFNSRQLFMRELYETHCWTLPEISYPVVNGRRTEKETVYGLKVLCVPSYEGPPLVLTDIN